MTIQPIGRRMFFLGAFAAGAALALPACQTARPLSLEEAIRRLLLASSENAFARLTAPGGYWDEQVARLGLANLLGVRGDAVSRVLTSPLFRERLQDQFADIAIEASYRAAPVVADAVRAVGYYNALDIVRGGPQAATAYLRAELGARLVEAMVPGLYNALAVASDPLIGQLLNAAVGRDVGAIARRFADQVDDAIWREIGREEAAIRANPGATRDPVLIGVFGNAPRY
ncbi:DUF4197 domain-containing protein [Porphyrobacter sp. GA68]|uniref:DUF4197 domain-containing protein n=1 Tax=Porphyrobacter sp. GA68 TaxID=2883480 RepID=UPI001D185726|nr:DUF4197 domain-containing protein [Porphyrobacter sp. GA68]